MSAGTQVAPYAWIAARCLYLSCPEELRGQLEINIHLFGVRSAERKRLVQLFANQPYLKLQHDILLLDGQLGFLGKQRFELLTPSARKWVARIGRRVPMFQPTAKRWLGRHRIGLYHQEWINQLCRHWQNEESLLVVDSDLFLADPRFFEKDFLTMQPEEFARGWVYRTNNAMIHQGQKLYPIGTELFLIRPGVHNQINIQQRNRDLLFDQLRAHYPGVEFQSENFVDTLYFACWMAQLKGYRVEAAYKHLHVCHPGGVGHLDAQHLLSTDRKSVV